MDEFWTSGFWRDLNEGDINFRDNLQFELKSKFPIRAKDKVNVFRQELFMFIPETLQIDKRTYPKDFFYMDQTNLIRYQTPVFSIQELIQPKSTGSPFFRIKIRLNQVQTREVKREIIDEMQLLATVFRSALRKRVRSLVIELKHPDEKLTKNTVLLANDLKHFRDYFLSFQKECSQKFQDDVLQDHLKHIEENILDTIEYYLTGYLDRLKKEDQNITQVLLEVERYRKDQQLMPNQSKDPVVYNEAILHRNSLLNKFVMEALKLNSNRIAMEEKYGHALGAVAAGVAMFIYLALFATTFFYWDKPPALFSSFPIILIAVVLYILKDRVKEGIKTLFTRRSTNWFPDYTTKIESPDGRCVGLLKEYFAFLREKDLPEGFLTIRNKQFHEELPTLKRHDSIIEYKREVLLYPYQGKGEERRTDINTIFRFNVHRFVEKANDSLQTQISLDAEKHTLLKERLPKVYHINIIIRNTFQKQSKESHTEIDRFRVVIDKSGIKRVERI